MARCCNYLKVRAARTRTRTQMRCNCWRFGWCCCWWWWLVSVGYGHFGLVTANVERRQTRIDPETHTLTRSDTCSAAHLFIYFLFSGCAIRSTSGCICEIRDQTCNRIDTNFKFSFPFRYRTVRKRQSVQVKTISFQLNGKCDSRRSSSQ